MAEIAGQLDGVRVLIVEDHADSLVLLAELLGIVGAVVRTASSASRAIEVLGEWVPDVLVSNIAMPDGDGLALLARVRALAPERGGLIPAIAVSGYVRRSDQLRFTAAGYGDVVAKPIDLEALRGAIARLARRDREAV